MKRHQYFLLAVALATLPLAGTSDSARATGIEPVGAPASDGAAQLDRLLAAGDLPGAEALARQLKASTDPVLNPTLYQKAVTSLIVSLRRQSKVREALSLAQQELPTGRWPIGSSQRATLVLGLAGALAESGRPAEGVDVLTAEAGSFESPDLPPQVRVTKLGVEGSLLMGLGRFAAAEPIMAAFAEAAESAYGVGNLRTAEAREAAGVASEYNQNLIAAEAAYRRATELARPISDRGAQQVSRHTMNLARMVLANGKQTQAVAIAEQAIADQTSYWQGAIGQERSITPLESRVHVTLAGVVIDSLSQITDPEAADPVTQEKVFQMIRQSQWGGQAGVLESVAEAAASAKQGRETGALGDLGMPTATLVQVQSNLARDEALLLVHDGVDKTTIMLVTRDTVQWRMLGVTRNAMCRRIATLRVSVSPLNPLRCPDDSVEMFSVATTSGADARPTGLRTAYNSEVAHSLYRDLIGDFRPMPRQIQRLLISSTGVYGAIPWAALNVTPAPLLPTSSHDPKQPTWLIERFEIALVARADSLLHRSSASTDRPLARRNFIGFGSAEAGLDMENAQALELRALAALTSHGKNQIVFGPVKARSILATSGDAGAMVFSAHGLVRQVGARIEPGIVLSNEGEGRILTASDIATSQLRARLVVLAGCDLATTDGQPSSDAFGPLVAAFAAIGTDAIIAPIGPVVDISSQKITQGAVGGVINRRQTASAALRTAQLRWLRTADRPDKAHPAHWAVFVAIEP